MDNDRDLTVGEVVGQGETVEILEEDAPVREAQARAATDRIVVVIDPHRQPIAVLDEQVLAGLLEPDEQIAVYRERLVTPIVTSVDLPVVQALRIAQALDAWNWFAALNAAGEIVGVADAAQLLDAAGARFGVSRQNRERILFEMRAGASGAALSTFFALMPQVHGKPLPPGWGYAEYWECPSGHRYTRGAITKRRDGSVGCPICGQLMQHHVVPLMP